MNSFMSPNYIPKVSVIVPVYNTELYVERAIISLMEQTLDDVQFIIIDDGSKDNSLNIIKQVITRYPARQGQVTLISRENRGVAATRAQGMELATGDYVIHLDSDDWAELNWLEALYTKAIEDNADVVVCDYRTIHPATSTDVKQPIGKDGVECVKKLLSGELLGPTWNKLIKRKLLVDNNIRFLSDINFLEDFILAMQAFLAANAIGYVSQPLINYNQCNESSITATVSEQKVNEIVSATKIINEVLCQHQLVPALSEQFNTMKLRLKYWILCRANKAAPDSFWGLYPEANKHIWQSSLSIHVKTVLYIASLKMFTVAQLIIHLVGLLKRIIK